MTPHERQPALQPPLELVLAWRGLQITISNGNMTRQQALEVLGASPDEIEQIIKAEAQTL